MTYSRKNHSTTLTNEDKALFDAAMRGVLPLGKRSKSEDTSVSLSSLQGKAIAQESPRIQLDAPRVSILPEQRLEYFHVSLPHRERYRLRKGKLALAASLDLHGMTLLQAEDALHQFFLRAKQHAWRHVLIIHGKGSESTGSPLKSALNQYLRNLPFVMGFCSAIPAQGGTGAVYVMLSKRS